MKPKLLGDITEYIQAEASRFFSGPVPLEILDQRLNACRSCEFLDKDEADPVGFCNSCGCGKRKRAELSIKTAMPRVGCPKFKWGDGDHRHPTFKSRWKALKEVENARNES